MTVPYEKIVRRRGPLGNWKKVAFATFVLVVLFSSGTLYLVVAYWPQLTSRKHRQPALSGDESTAHASAVKKEDRSEGSIKERIDRIVDRSLMAMGGVGKFAGLKDMVQVGTSRVSSPAGEITGTRVLYMTSSPHMFRLEQKILGREIITGFDGTKAWQEQDGQPLSLPSQMLGTMGKEMDRNQLLVDYKKGRYHVDYLGRAPFLDKKQVHQLVFKDAQGGETAVFIDSETDYVAAYTFTEPSLGREIEVRMNDYRGIGEYAFPFLITTYLDGEMGEEITIEKITINGGLDRSLFAPSAPVRD